MAYGKIALLPQETREHLNRRLASGEPGTQLLAWLNGLPVVRRLLDESFDGRDITDGNLSDWKLGGHRDWLAQQAKVNRMRWFSEEAKVLTDAVNDTSLADKLATEIAARYAELIDGWDGRADKDFENKIRGLRMLSQDISRLRRGDHTAGRLQLALDQHTAGKWEEGEWAWRHVLEPMERWPRAKRAFQIAFRIYEQEKANHHPNGAPKPRRVRGPDANGVIRVVDPDGTW